MAVVVVVVVVIAITTVVWVIATIVLVAVTTFFPHLCVTKGALKAEGSTKILTTCHQHPLVCTYDIPFLCNYGKVCVLVC